MSDLEIDFGGMRAILAMTFSMSVWPIRFFPLAFGQEHLRGARLVDHVDGLVRQFAVGDLYFAESSTAALMASSVYFSLWKSS